MFDSALEDALVYERFQVKSLPDSNEILEIAIEFMPDLFLLDYRLDEGNGEDLCKRLKSHTKLKHIPVIIFSAYLPKNINFAAMCCDDFISKPFDLNELVEKIDNLLSAQLV